MPMNNIRLTERLLKNEYVHIQDILDIVKNREDACFLVLARYTVDYYIKGREDWTNLLSALKEMRKRIKLKEEEYDTFGRFLYPNPIVSMIPTWTPEDIDNATEVLLELHALEVRFTDFIVKNNETLYALNHL